MRRTMLETASLRQCSIAASVMLLLQLATPLRAASLQLGGPFSDAMVIQRDAPIRIWGDATPGDTVTIRLGAHQATATADAHGHWQASLPPMPAGGPFALTVRGKTDSIELHDVLCGDVWLCSGQSNMQLTTAEDLNAPALLKDAPHLRNLRLLLVPKHFAATPLDRFDAHWQAADARSVSHFADVGYQFGRDLMADPALKNVPIGLIDSSFGGTAIEGWVPAPTLAAEFKPSDLMDSIFGIKPAQLYNGMIAPLGPLGLRGVVWYQGENNSPRAPLYPRLFAAMAKQWRQQFDDPSLWFLLVQLPRYADLYGDFPFTWMREAQEQVVTQVPHTALAVTLDTSNGFDLHPRDKGEVARRVSLLARHFIYHENLAWHGPAFIEAKASGSRMVLRFDTGGGPLVSASRPLLGFELAGSDGIYHPASARIDGDSVIVQSPQVDRPIDVRYAWGASPDATLYNAAGLPAAPFRTDHAPAVATPEFFPVAPALRMVTGKYQAIINGDGIISSITVGGHQFLSNDGGNNGGCLFPSAFGPRRIYQSTRLSPDTVRFSDPAVRATYQFAPSEMTWRLDNNGDGPTVFRINLNPAVALTPAPGGAIALTRDRATLTITGADAPPPNAPHNGGGIETSIPAHGSRTIFLTITSAG